MLTFQRLLLLFLSLVLSKQVVAADRVALVIGNSDYQVGRLKNPINDAQAVAKSLKDDLGFEVVLATNTNRRALLKSVQNFRKKITKDSIALFYYSGHGIEVAGKNYLLPVNNQDIKTQEDVPIESVAANDILRHMEASNSKLNIMVLDACRDNPLPSTSKSSNRGLSRIEGSRGSIIAYATRAGQVAQDGFTNHSPFTQALLNNLTKPGYSVPEMFNSVGLEVLKSTNGVQTPWISTSPVPRVFLANNSNSSFEQSTSSQHMGDLTPAELSAWQGVRQCTDINKVRAFIDKFPNGTFTPVAKNCLNNLMAKQPLALYVDTKPSNATVRVLNISSKYQYGMKLKPQRYQVEISQKGYQTKTQWFELSKSTQSFYAALDKIETKNHQDQTYTVNGVSFTMKAIPAGSFEMGCVSGIDCQDNELPVHTVTLPAFHMMETETTFALWDACVDDGGCSHQPDDEGWGRDTHPVMNVSFDDITKEFIPWLNTQLGNQTGQRFSLPSEAQWEHAARAGTTTKYSWGNGIDCSKAHYSSNECGRRISNVMVKSFSSNDFGLFDMHGNVREWTQDCWNDSYNGAPANGSAWQSGDCNRRVYRGGSGNNSESYVRSAIRNYNPRTGGAYYHGFRLVLSSKSESLVLPIETVENNSQQGGRLHEKLTGATFENTQGENGVTVVNVLTGSAAESVGLKVGDTVIGINRIPSKNLNALAKLLLNKQGVVALVIKRKNNQLYLMLR